MCLVSLGLLDPNFFFSLVYFPSAWFLNNLLGYVSLSFTAPARTEESFHLASRPKPTYLVPSSLSPSPHQTQTRHPLCEPAPDLSELVLFVNKHICFKYWFKDSYETQQNRLVNVKKVQIFSSPWVLCSTRNIWKISMVLKWLPKGTPSIMHCFWMGEGEL